MSLQIGKKLGPYEIVAFLGAGGMGEVYRAKDDRLGREVAVKVLPASFATDSDRLRRFEQEARAAGQLNHPNVMAVFDVGVSEGTPYLVSELLEGESLRQALDSGPLPPRKAVEFAVQTANGLAAAHAKGIVHRDLKPENLFVVRDGSVKILDFGLAKLTREHPESADDGGTRHYAMTASGEILGTASYMSPEQVRAKATDHRTDLFAVGAILFEMLTAEKAFPGETAADRMSAILHADPPHLPEAALAAIPGVDSVIRRCLEKRPEARIDSARDLAFALELLLGVASSGKRGGAAAVTAEAPAAELLIRRLTFREGWISGARFAPDGQTVIYSASWEGKPPELYQARVGSPESRSMGIKHADLLSISSTGELAISLKPRDVGGFIRLGTLARMPLIGGAPRELLDDVYQADWSPDGKSLVVIRDLEGAARIEYPIGKALYEAGGWVSHPRVSPDGKLVAFCDHPTRGDNAGGVAIVDLEGRMRHLAVDFSLIWGLAWAPEGDAVWFTGQRAGNSEAIYAVTMEGSVRLVHKSTAYLFLADLLRSGEALLVNLTPRMRLEHRAKGSSETTELSWLEWSLVRDMTPDGRFILFDETGSGGGMTHSLYMRGTDGSPAVRLGDGVAMRFSPDGRWVLAVERTDNRGLVLIPTGVGENVFLPMGDIHIHWAQWFPDGKSLCFVGREPGHRLRIYRYDLERREAKPFTEEGVGRGVTYVSPDGRFVPATGPSGTFALYPTDGGKPQPLDSIGQDERPARWSEDGASLWVFERSRIPTRIHLVDIATGRREFRMEIAPRYVNGVGGINNIVMTPDGESYATSYTQTLSELYAVRGLH